MSDPSYGTRQSGRQGNAQGEGGEQTIVSIRIRSGNKRKGEQGKGEGGGQTIVSMHKDKVRE